MRSVSAKRVSWILAVLGIAVVAVLLAANASRDRPVAVSTTHAAKQDLSAWISSNGKVEPIEPHILQAQLTTFIEKVFVKEGQAVTQGQVLHLPTNTFRNFRRSRREFNRPLALGFRNSDRRA